MKKFTKSVIAVLTAVLMICSVLPVAVFADTGEMRNCTFYILYVDDSFRLGYNYSDKAKWNVEYECAYSNCGAGSNNHSMKCSVIKEQVDYAKTIVDSGWEIEGWTKKESANPQILTTYSGTTATQTSYTIYIVAKKTTPPTPTTKDITLTFDANGGAFADGTAKTYTQKVGINESASFDLPTVNPTREGFEFKGWSTSQNATAPDADITNPYEISQSTTLYAVWQEIEKAPDKPTKSYINQLTEVKFVCDTNNDHSGSYVLPGDSEEDTTYTIGEVSKNESGVYTVTVTVDGTKYLDLINSRYGKHEIVGDTSKSFKLNYVNEKWEVAGESVTFHIKDVTIPTPVAPNADKVLDSIDPTDFVKFDCTNNEHDKAYDLKKSSITNISAVNDDNGTYTVTVTVNGADYLDKYNSDVKVDHELTNSTQTFTLTYNNDEGAWELLGEITGVTFAVTEKTTPTDPSKVSEPSVEKTAEKTTVKAGDNVKFNLSVALPDYLNNYLYDDPQNPGIATQVEKHYWMTINDSYDEKFGNLAGLTVNVVHADKTTSALTDPTNYTFTAGADNHSFNISVDLVDLFNKGLLTANDIENIGKVRINVEYTLTMSSDVTYGTFTNTASVSYINKDGESATSEDSNASVQVYAIEIKKLDNADKTTLLPNAKFDLLDADKNKIADGTTAADGTLTFNGLAGGTYYLEETAAPGGYAKSDKLLEVTLNGDGKIVTVNFYNSKVPHTGSDTALIFSIAGIVIVGAGFAGYAITRKKREN